MVSIAIGLIVGVVIGFIIHYVFTVRKSSRKKRVRVDTFMKFITITAMAHGMILSTLSYILAFFAKEPVASVSEVIVREVLAPVAVYGGTNLVMNIFEKNKMSFSVPLNSIVSKNDDEKAVG